jgi:endo-1,4-beta-xylanase
VGIKEVTRRKFIRNVATTFGACRLLPLHSAIPSAEKGSAQYDAPTTPLKDQAARKGLLYGSCVQRKQLTSDSALEGITVAQCGIVVPEVALKWDHLRPSPTTYDFADADWLLNFAQQNQMKFRAVPIIWHEALPRWFAEYMSPQNAKQLLLDHISTVVGRYASTMHSWDVVNEVISPDDKRADGLRDTPWLRNLGPGHIEMAFRAVHEADTNALLTWNENWLEEDSALGDAKRGFLLQHLKDFLSRGVPVQAIGLQSHIFGDHANVAGPHFREFLSQITDMGLKIIITEMDIRERTFPNDIAARDQATAFAYHHYLHTVLEHKSVIAVLTWGLSDKYTWLTQHDPRADKAPVRPLPYDANVQPKPARYAIAHAFDQAPSR